MKKIYVANVPFALIKESSHRLKCVDHDGSGQGGSAYEVWQSQDNQNKIFISFRICHVYISFHLSTLPTILLTYMQMSFWHLEKPTKWFCRWIFQEFLSNGRQVRRWSDYVISCYKIEVRQKWTTFNRSPSWITFDRSAWQIYSVCQNSILFVRF